MLLALVSGAIDGWTILAPSLPIRLPVPIPALFILVAAMTLIPLVVGMPVASTLLMGLVRFNDRERPMAVTDVGLVAIAVAGVSSRRGLPMSPTLALVVDVTMSRQRSWIALAFVLPVSTRPQAIPS